MTQDDELAWIEKAQAGDKHAFDCLILRYQDRIAHVIHRYLIDSAAVADASQEVFIRAYKSLALFRGDSAFYTWLYRIAINTAKYHYSTEKRLAKHTVCFDEALTQLANSRLRDFATPENLLAREEMEDRLSIIIEKLSPELRIALILREVDGLSYEEIAHAQNCKLGTVRSRLARAREFLAKQLKVLMIER